MSSNVGTSEPSDSKFTQQELPACKPILTPSWVILTFLVAGVVFIPLGVICLFASQGVLIVFRFCLLLNFFILTVSFGHSMRYVKSRSDAQLRSPREERDVQKCAPEDNVGGEPIVPCGLVAWSLFNDTYQFSRNSQELPVNKKDISWKSDRDSKFGKNVFPKNFQTGAPIGGGTLDPNKPLYGKIETDLNAGDTIRVLLGNNYNTYSFNGEKKLVLSTTSWLGGRNDFLGGSVSHCGQHLLVLGCYILRTISMKWSCCLMGFRQLGDPLYLSWNRSPGG
ncbi:hypothetical protein Bca52824_084975 [Brassica carinata]|uniref:ALA-interacting subunit n=1 Tax=Brassica carinata TaxID=52824 RepID=A0A8X7PLX8_BRACI|nr:hypothetical protein Bca52824_084975 [Brassica carinata]